MVVLALDTTVRSGSVAVLRGRETLVERIGDPAVPHGRRLPGDVLAAIEAAHVTLADVDLYAVASGPGAFTGLRIGIATIQGLAFAHGRPVVAVSALDALAHQALAQAPAGAGTLIATWMDAARGEVFAALYEVPGREATEEDEAVTLRDEPSVGPPESTLERWREILGGRPVVAAGEGAQRYEHLIRAQLGESGWRLAAPAPLAAVIGRLALSRAAQGKAGPPHAVRPLYVRRPDAELARDRAAGAGSPGARTRS